MRNQPHAIKLALLGTLSKGGFHSGEELGASLGVSRAAISKHIKGIQEWGVDVHRVQGKGYQLAQPMQLLDENTLKHTIDTKFALVPVIESTNQYILDNSSELESGFVCLAEYQSKGRGRRGRQWISPFGSNLYLSMYWQLDAGMAAAMGLSLVVGVALAESLEQLGVPGVKLKWPNDLYHDDKKLAGILVEMSGQAGAAANLVIGVGLNLSMAETVDGISQPWTSLSNITAKPVDRNQLAALLVKTLNTTLQDYESFGMGEFVARWNRLDNYLGRKVKLLIGNKSVEGVARGIDKQGAVLLETEQGTQSFIGGEISLRNNE
ncbi:bifunctional biotin--[acetyl-CoA-carboxylase] ligase/biotin operon repressor BirA [Vibrio sp. S4M6]|uniref:bifunctional biotin--[acetyl-CoA-carboxylase] ligase/biotin operon repressor BirA n=1 Tax=Vibrio sinus TaxID=2946865 RepID=UPI00202A1B46|nr:bifunctional biotin--[acetyl-CoA-carboxylase] ligase/biotin operon repressor BirA [Vibrio sinus]MCL9780377.1 bifunctional biotin--[acetyl-CoA-carboxylase] ligase/biotin operon repressor BirA [Vibrio sinus]